MQDRIESKLGLNPVEEEVVVLYDGEKAAVVSQCWFSVRLTS